MARREDQRGFRLGVLMLETRFPRPPGDIGNPATFGFPVIYRRIPAATVAAVATPESVPAAPALVDAFTDGARALAAEGADLIATSCGFLLPLQERLERACGRPVIASSLALLPELRAEYGADARFGIITFDAAALERLDIDRYHPLMVRGLDRGGVLYRTISEDRDHLDVAAARADAVAAAMALTAATPKPDALILECTNLGPYRADIAAATGLPVHDIATAIDRHRARRTPGLAGPA